MTLKRPSSAPHTILDKHGRIIGALAGTPSSPDWAPCVENVGRLFDDLRLESKTSLTDDRRGDFAVVNFGFSYGGGQTVRSSFCSKLIRIHDDTAPYKY